MSKTITMTQNYTNIQGENVPINLAPCGIKCIGCNQVFDPQNIQAHLNTHINPQYIKAVQVQNRQGPSKLNLNKFPDDPQKLQQIWVKSFLPSQLPQIEKQKKLAQRPTSDHLLLKNSVFEHLIEAQPDSKKDLASHLGDTVDQSVQAQQQLDIKKSIKLGKTYNQIKKKELHVYKNQHSTTSNVDNYISRTKQNKGQDTQASDGYSVVPNQDMERQNLKLSTPRKENRQTYNISSDLKNPVRSLYISTVSKPDLKLENTQIRDNNRLKHESPGSTILGGSSQKHNHDNHNMCPCCKGFYCSYCKSSVPPIYRPVPDKNGNYHFHPQQNQRSIQFYQDHYYPREAKNVCTNCDKRGNRLQLESTPSHF